MSGETASVRGTEHTADGESSHIHKVTCTTEITDDDLPFGAGTMVVDHSGSIVVRVNRAQLVDDPEGVVAEMGRHLSANSHAYGAPLRAVPEHMAAI